MADPVMAQRIAAKYADILREWLGDATMAAIRATNTERRAKGDTCSCAAHDHCDANIAMQDAFESVVGRGIYLPYQVDNGEATAEQADADLTLWNAAYEHAMRHHLTVQSEG